MMKNKRFWICLNDDHGTSGLVTKGRIYEVEDLEKASQFLKLKKDDKGNEDTSMFKWRFKRVEEGDVFVIGESSYDNHFKTGEKVVLTEDDGTRIPFFTRQDGKSQDTHCLWWDELVYDEALNADVPEQEPVPEPESEGIWIVFSPNSSKAPTKVFNSHKQARYVARQMASTNDGDFLVMKATERYSSTGVVKEVL